MGAWSRTPADEELRDKIRILSAVPGLMDRWWQMGDKAACTGNTLSLKACMTGGAPWGFVRWRCRGVGPQVAEKPRYAKLHDYPSDRGQPEVGAAESGRLSGLRDCTSDPRALLSRPIIKPDRVRMVRD